MYDPVGGAILLDGVDLRDYSVEELRKEVGVIFQDYMRYDMRVAENIGFGRIEAVDELPRVQEAARKSYADSMIEALPQGYEQMLGRRFEGGMDLSGGQWQKLALARAYMRDAQVLILDERPQPSMRAPNTRYSCASPSSLAIAWRCLSRIAFRPSGWQIESWFLMAGA
ncbi:MAG: ATP-binding cassette domain-containing protein [Bryobacteraceae bacterium]